MKPKAPENEFQGMLARAEQQLAVLIAERNALTQKIAGLEKTIEGLSTLCNPVPNGPSVSSPVAEAMIRHAGLTDVLRMVLQASGPALNIGGMLQLLASVGYPLDRLQNPRAAANVILGRLVTSGEAERQGEGENITYSWVRGTNPQQLEVPYIAKAKRSRIAEAFAKGRFDSNRFNPK